MVNIMPSQLLEQSFRYAVIHDKGISYIAYYDIPDYEPRKVIGWVVTDLTGEGVKRVKV